MGNQPTVERRNPNRNDSSNGTGLLIALGVGALTAGAMMVADALSEPEPNEQVVRHQNSRVARNPHSPPKCDSDLNSKQTGVSPLQDQNRNSNLHKAPIEVPENKSNQKERDPLEEQIVQFDKAAIQEIQENVVQGETQTGNLLFSCRFFLFPSLVLCFSLFFFFEV